MPQTRIFKICGDCNTAWPARKVCLYKSQPWKRQGYLENLSLTRVLHEERASKCSCITCIHHIRVNAQEIAPYISCIHHVHVNKGRRLGVIRSGTNCNFRKFQHSRKNYWIVKILFNYRCRLRAICGLISGDHTERCWVNLHATRGPLDDPSPQVNNVVDTLFIEKAASLRRTTAGTAINYDLILR